MLKRKYDTQAEIPAGFESLYKEVEGKWVRDDAQIEGASAGDSVPKLEKALADERKAHKATGAKLAAFGDLTPEVATAAVTERDELKLKVEAGGAKPDDAKIAELVNARVAQKTAPLDKKINELTTQRDAAVTEATSLKDLRKRDRIALAIQEAAVKSGVLKESVGRIVSLNTPMFDVDEEGNVRTKEGPGVVPGLDPAAVLNDMKSTDPYFWPTSQGGGATGGAAGGVGGNNPWTKAHWNMTAQGQIMAKDGKKAAALAAQAGVDVNAMEPKQ